MGFLKTLAMDNGIQIKTIPDEYKALLASCDGGCACSGGILLDAELRGAEKSLLPLMKSRTFYLAIATIRAPIRRKKPGYLRRSWSLWTCSGHMSKGSPWGRRAGVRT